MRDQKKKKTPGGAQPPVFNTARAGGSSPPGHWVSSAPANSAGPISGVSNQAHIPNTYNAVFVSRRKCSGHSHALKMHPALAETLRITLASPKFARCQIARR